MGNVIRSGPARRPWDHEQVNFPSYPSPSGPNAGGPQPGLYPLRPLRIGEIFGASLRVAWRHLAVLAPIALIFQLTSAVALIGMLAANGSLHDYATGDYLTLPANPTPAEVSAVLDYVVHNILGALAVTLLIGLISGPILAGFATPFAAIGATTVNGTNEAALARLKGRVGVLLGLGVVVGVVTGIGYLLLIVPGVILWLMLMPAAPVAAMERLSIPDSIRRGIAVSNGFKGRLFGVSALAALISGGISFAASSILGNVISSSDPVRHLVLTQGLAVLIGSLLMPWSSTVTAMLYIDIRMRREGLAEALQAAAR